MWQNHRNPWSLQQWPQNSIWIQSVQKVGRFSRNELTEHSTQITLCEIQPNGKTEIMQDNNGNKKEKVPWAKRSIFTGGFKAHLTPRLSMKKNASEAMIDAQLWKTQQPRKSEVQINPFNWRVSSPTVQPEIVE